MVSDLYDSSRESREVEIEERHEDDSIHESVQDGRRTDREGKQGREIDRVASDVLERVLGNDEIMGQDLRL